eukprot:TRINITY_DN109717_c0_g1_i1.p1 TRINITY_DN109717_c0_g1~~TRINITY_DN109717_c0_g1_i1.p1  ORF type:complete len:1269 (-),score=306.07 TRINITY_DN109717_c0_g1_i1:84-3419(-)
MAAGNALAASAPGALGVPQLTANPNAFAQMAGTFAAGQLAQGGFALPLPGQFPEGLTTVGSDFFNASTQGSGFFPGALPVPAHNQPPKSPSVASSAEEGAAFGRMEQNRKMCEKIKGELDQMKVETMYNMVDEVKVNFREHRSTCRVLFLKNAQASAFSPKSMPRVRAALKLREPKMVIRLMPSRFGSHYWKQFPFFSGGRDGGRFPTKQISELSVDDRAEVEHRMTLLAKEILLPLAVRNHALVVGFCDCSLMQTFIKVSGPLRRQMGENCPFQLLQFGYAYLYHVASERKNSYAWAFKSQCPSWQQASFKSALAARYGDDQAYWPHHDFLDGQYATVVFECLDSLGNLLHDPADTFQNDFISSLALNLPVIGLQTYGVDKLTLCPAMADHVNRGMPLMLLDSRKREEEMPSTMDDVQEHLFAMADELWKKGICDAYNISVMAFIKSAIDFFANREQAAKDEDPKRQWIWQAIEHQKNKKQDLLTAASQDDDDEEGHVALVPEMFDQAVVKGTNFVMSYVGKNMEWESNHLSGRCGMAIEQLMQATDWPDLASRIDEHYLKLRGCAFHNYKRIHNLMKEHPWVVLQDKGRDTHEGRYKLTIDLDQVGATSFETGKNLITEMFMEEYGVCLKFDAAKKREAVFVADEDLWLAVYEILKSRHVYSGNLHHLGKVEKQLFNIARIDRLPEANSLEGLVLLRRAWTLCDVFVLTAWYYKRISKISYFIMLVLGVLIVAVTVAGSLYPDLLSENLQRNLLLGLALFGSFTTGLIARIEPYKKWMQLRGGALALEAEVWKYRTRSGDYSTVDSLNNVGRQQAERRAEAYFQETLLAVQETVLVSAGMKETSFYSAQTSTDDVFVNIKEFKDFKTKAEKKAASKSKVATAIADQKSAEMNLLADSHSGASQQAPLHQMKHGQYKGCSDLARPGPGDDTHHAPATPHEYIRWRLMPAMQFYQRRIPRYSRKQRIIQALLLLSSIATAALAALEYSKWTAIVASISGAIAAWHEYEGMSNKLERYSTVSCALMNVLMWWQSLPEVDQASVLNVEHLVGQTETLINSEHSAWLSDIQQAAKSGRAIHNQSNAKKDEEQQDEDDDKDSNDGTSKLKKTLNK